MLFTIFMYHTHFQICAIVKSKWQTNYYFCNVKLAIIFRFTFAEFGRSELFTIFAANDKSGTFPEIK